MTTLLAVALAFALLAGVSVAESAHRAKRDRARALLESASRRQP